MFYIWFGDALPSNGPNWSSRVRYMQTLTLWTFWISVSVNFWRFAGWESKWIWSYRETPVAYILYCRQTDRRQVGRQKKISKRINSQVGRRAETITVFGLDSPAILVSVFPKTGLSVFVPNAEHQRLQDDTNNQKWSCEAQSSLRSAHNKLIAL